MLAAIRLRGSTRSRRPIEDTLQQLKLKRNNSCIVVPDNDSYRGMLQKAKDFITWGEVSEETADRLVEKKGLKKADGDDPYRGLVFRLAPPETGFKNSLKEQYPTGELGNRGEAIEELINNMLRE